MGVGGCCCSAVSTPAAAKENTKERRESTIGQTSLAGEVRGASEGNGSTLCREQKGHDNIVVSLTLFVALQLLHLTRILLQNGRALTAPTLQFPRAACLRNSSCGRLRR